MGVDKLFKIIDMIDCFIVVLFGDGVGVVVMGEVVEGCGIISYEMGLDGSGGKYLYLDREIGKFKMNGREVFKFVVRIMGDVFMCVVEKVGLLFEDIDLFVLY